MKLKNQENIMPDLIQMAKSKKHNILISGIKGSGKSYLAKQYAKILNIPDFQLVEPKINVVREVMESCVGLNHPIVICIENLDLGVQGTSYAILKFLEEPSENVYIVITCRNIRQIPDTIVSRAVTMELAPMIKSDLTDYAREKNQSQFEIILQDKYLWQCVMSIDDIDILFELNQSQVEYIASWKALFHKNYSVSEIMWKLQKFPDSSSIPISILIRYIMYSGQSAIIFEICSHCLTTIENSKIASHVALAKLIFELRYGVNI